MGTRIEEELELNPALEEGKDKDPNKESIISIFYQYLISILLALMLLSIIFSLGRKLATTRSKEIWTLTLLLNSLANALNGISGFISSIMELYCKVVLYSSCFLLGRKQMPLFTGLLFFLAIQTHRKACIAWLVNPTFISCSYFTGEGSKTLYWSQQLWRPWGSLANFCQRVGQKVHFFRKDHWRRYM